MPCPVILISPGVQEQGFEFSDRSLSLSEAYTEAVSDAGGLPLVMAPCSSASTVAEAVSLAAGVLMTGGDDIDPRLYADEVRQDLLDTVGLTPDAGRRDLRELLLVREVFRQRKPLLAICRGHQMVNVALGGTLLLDIPTQKPGSLDHKRMDARNDIVHEVRLTEDSLIAKIAGTRKLGVNSTHHQAIDRVAASLRVTAVSSDGVVEALELAGSAANWLPFFLSLQFHPERLRNRHQEHREVFRTFVRTCGSSLKTLL